MEAKRAKIKENRETLETRKRERFDSIVDTLDFFNGKLSLEDVMTVELPFLEDLKRAQQRLLLVKYGDKTTNVQ